jgi:hypothetical protein
MGGHAPTSIRLGVAWIRRLPIGFHLKCFTMFREVDRVALDPRGFERFVEDAARRPDERPTLLVLLVTGLLADHHDARSFSALPKTACVAPFQSGHPRQALCCLLVRGERSRSR